MGVDAKEIGNFMWKILGFLMSTSYRFIRNHQVFSAVSLFLFLVYLFLPSDFYFLLYSSPILVCIGIYFGNYSKPGPFKIESSSREKKPENGLSSSVVQTGSLSSNSRKDLRPQRSVRQNARRKVDEMGKDWDSQASEDEKDKVLLTALYNELLGRGTPQTFEESTKETTLPGEQEISSDLTGERSSCNPENRVTDPFEKLTGGGGETEVESLEEDEDDEETQENGNNAVEWNDDDQKNLMDLGISEIERNKRLESLIARRRARKLFLLAAEKSLMDMEIPPICVGRNNFGFDFQSNCDFNGLQMPGSAPSVLLPTRNPFDLPYDPQEEKPNLTGDSFHQEFALANQKDMFFCHHESFCRGHLALGYVQDSNLESYSNTEKRAIDGPQLDKGDDDGHPVEQQEPLSEEHHPTKGTNPETESGNSIKAETKTNSPCPRSEVQIETDSIRKDDSDSNSSFATESEKDFNAGIQAESSGASDQTDGKGKFPMGLGDHIRNSLTDVALPRGNASSSLASERQRYMEHFGYNTGKGHHMVTQSMDSDLQVEVSEMGSPPTKIGENDWSDEEKTLFVYESDFGKEMGFSCEETRPKPQNENEHEFIASKNEAETNSSSSDAFSVENLKKGMQMTEAAMVLQPREVNSEIAEEPQELPQKPAEVIKISYDLDEQEQARKIDPESPKHAKKNHEERISQEMNEEKDQNHEKPIRGNFLEPVQLEQTAETSVQETRDGDRIHEQAAVVSDVNHENLSESISATPQAGSSVEDVSPSNSTSSSPRSVLLEKLPLDQTYLLNFEDREHVDVPQNGTENTVKDSSSSYYDQTETENATPEEFQQAHLVENTLTDQDTGKSEFSTSMNEPSGPSGKPTEDRDPVMKELNDSDTTRTVDNGSVINPLTEDFETDQTENIAADAEGKSSIASAKKSEVAAEPSKPASETNSTAHSNSRKENSVKEEDQVGLSNLQP